MLVGMQNIYRYSYVMRAGGPGEVLLFFLFRQSLRLGKRLEISQDSNGRVVVTNLTWKPIKGLTDFDKIYRNGINNREVGYTKANDYSSRSHLVIAIEITCQVRKKIVMHTHKHRVYLFKINQTSITYISICKKCCDHCQDISRSRATVSKLSFVDMAGSERLARTEASGARLVEAQHINRSLAALGDVMAALSQKRPHVPFRNSRLTHVCLPNFIDLSSLLLFAAVVAFF